MNFTPTYFDVQPYLNSGKQPAIIIPRQGKHRVLTTALNDPNTKILWAMTQFGDMLRIPVIAYAVPYPPEQGRMPSLFAVGVEMGMRAVENFVQQFGNNIDLVDLIIGDRGHDLAPERNAYRVYIGIAIKTKD